MCLQNVFITLQINQPTNAATSQVYYLTFMYSSSFFGRLHAIIRSSTTVVAPSGFTIGAW
jgi:hypothetical protein